MFLYTCVLEVMMENCGLGVNHIKVNTVICFIFMQKFFMINFRCKNIVV